MKRLLLFSLALYGAVSVNAQVTTNSSVTKSNATANSPYTDRAKQVDATKAKTKGEPTATSNSALLVAKKKRGPGVGTVIGITAYDLQTNGSTQPRIQTLAGNVGCTWTMDASGSGDAAFPARGTGYNAKLAGIWGTNPTVRIENIRTGFNSYMLTGTNETIICHDGATSNLVHLTRPIATGAWTQSTTKFPNDAAAKAIWPHAATAGNYVYVVDAGTDTNIYANGIRRGHYWSRSIDGGVTWPIDHVPFPGLDSLDLGYASADNYSIDAKDSIVAVLFGSDAQYGSTVLFKSTDYGTTWTRTDLNRSNNTGVGVNSYASVMIDFVDNTTLLPPADGITDTFTTDDGNLEVLIDNNNKVHCFWGTKRAINSGAGLSIFPTTQVLHYMEGNSTINIMDNILFWQHDQNDDLDIQLGDNSLVPGTAKTNDANYGNYGYINAISSTVDANNNIYVFYSMIVDGDTTSDAQNPSILGVNGQGFRDIYVNVLKAGDTMFSINGDLGHYPVNVTKTHGIEESWPSVPKRITGTMLPLLFHSDEEPGIYLVEDDQMTQNEVRYMELNTTNILSQINDSTSINQVYFLSNNDIANENIGNVFPNPTASDLFVVIKNGINETAKVTITDVLGNIVSKITTKPVDGMIKLNTETLKVGNYFVTVENNYGRDTHKFIINK